MVSTIFETQRILFNENHFGKAKLPYKRLEVTYESLTGKYVFWLGGRGSAFQRINRVYGTDGISGEQALVALLNEKKIFVSRRGKSELTVHLVNAPTDMVLPNRGVRINAAAVSAKPSKDELIVSMTNSAMSDGWDMVVAYDLDTINNVLKTLYNDPSGKVIKQIVLGSGDDPYTISYTPVNVPGVFTGLTLTVVAELSFSFSEPGIQFSSGSANDALLNMPITSATQSGASYTLKLLSPQPTVSPSITKDNAWYKSTDGVNFVAVTSDEVNQATDLSVYYILANDKSLDNDPQFQNKLYNLVSLTVTPPESVLATGYGLQANVPIACLTGSDTIIPGDQVVSFDESTGTAKLVLNFNTSAGSGTSYTFNQNGTAVNPPILNDFPDILLRLQNYFSANVAAIDYVLTALSSQTVTGSVPLTPKSFRFNTQTVGDFACLALFIQTNESGLSAGGSNLNFQDANNNPFIPICADASTTLIFSRNFMSNFYLPTGLNASNFTGAANVGTGNTAVSVTATYNFNRQLNISVSLHLSFWQSMWSNYTGVSADPVQFEGVPMTLQFNSSNQLVLGIDLQASTILRLPWQNPPGMCGLPGDSGEDDYNVGITVNVSPGLGTSTLNWTVDSAGDLSLGFEVTQADYDVIINVSGMSESCGSDSQSQIVSDIKSQVGNILPLQTITLTTLKTVAETNLLFNGQQKFKLNTGLNVSSPLDVVAFGDIS